MALNDPPLKVTKRDILSITVYLPSNSSTSGFIEYSKPNQILKYGTTKDLITTTNTTYITKEGVESFVINGAIKGDMYSYAVWVSADL